MVIVINLGTAGDSLQRSAAQTLPDNDEGQGRSKAGKLRPPHPDLRARAAARGGHRQGSCRCPGGLDPWAGGSPGAKFGGQRAWAGVDHHSPTRRSVAGPAYRFW